MKKVGDSQLHKLWKYKIGVKLQQYNMKLIFKSNGGFANNWLHGRLSLPVNQGQ
jgi:hypothetical protein